MTHENWENIIDNLHQLVIDSKLKHLNGDCSLKDTKKHIRDETMFSVIHNFRCSCGNRIEWGICIRGTPILQLHAN